MEEIFFFFSSKRRHTRSSTVWWDRRCVIRDRASPERLVGRMPVEGNTQPIGLLHGGANVVLAESLGSIGTQLHAGPNLKIVGVDINATHHQSWLLNPSDAVDELPRFLLYSCLLSVLAYFIFIPIIFFLSALGFVTLSFMDSRESQ